MTIQQHPLNSDGIPPGAPKHIGDRIRYARRCAHLSLGELANILRQSGVPGASEQLIHNWETKHQCAVPKASLIAMERATGFSAAWLDSGQGEAKVASAVTGTTQPDGDHGQALPSNVIDFTQRVQLYGR